MHSVPIDLPKALCYCYFWAPLVACYSDWRLIYHRIVSWPAKVSLKVSMCLLFQATVEDTSGTDIPPILSLNCVFFTVILMNLMRAGLPGIFCKKLKLIPRKKRFCDHHKAGLSHLSLDSVSLCTNLKLDYLDFWNNLRGVLTYKILNIPFHLMLPVVMCCVIKINYTYWIYINKIKTNMMAFSSDLLS